MIRVELTEIMQLLSKWLTLVDLQTDKEELHVSAHPSAQLRVRARQGRAGLGLRNFLYLKFVNVSCTAYP